MPISMRLEFQLTDGTSGERPTVGDLKQWLALVEKSGVSDEEELLLERSRYDTIEGFFVFAFPDDES
ncbi:hypothetical protein [Zhihengliuella flava]|uniref:Uncharacterized protein n=1 Tax=Zhihengliuella flava TaxID=1285193 RepID=A0A931DCD9_9MICC|nr:hypothetical protein [Zhihengliuella flava]MBG6085842.1 hypothetical protein [Zhihengliuella flava]